MLTGEGDEPQPSAGALQLQEFCCGCSQQDLLKVLAELQALSEDAEGISAPGMPNQPILHTKKTLSAQSKPCV